MVIKLSRRKVLVAVGGLAGLLCARAALPQSGARIEWNSLPFQWAISIKRGNGRRKIAVLADHNCDYCQRFEQTLAQIDDITVYLFLYPVVRSQSVRQAKAVWCSKDRATAWLELVINRKEPTASPDCNNPIENILKWGTDKEILGTPTWILENGERRSGLVAASELRALLDHASPLRK